MKLFAAILVAFVMGFALAFAPRVEAANPTGTLTLESTSTLVAGGRMDVSWQTRGVADSTPKTFALTCSRDGSEVYFALMSVVSGHRSSVTFNLPAGAYASASSGVHAGFVSISLPTSGPAECVLTMAAVGVTLDELQFVVL